MIFSTIITQCYMISCAVSTAPISSVTAPICFYRKLKRTGNVSNKHVPSAPLTSLHANITTDNEVVLSFEDDTFSDIDVTIAYGDTIIYCDHYAHKEGSTISIPLAIIDDQDSYVITIKKGTVEYTAQFSF